VLFSELSSRVFVFSFVIFRLRRAEREEFSGLGSVESGERHFSSSSFCLLPPFVGFLIGLWIETPSAAELLEIRVVSDGGVGGVSLVKSEK